MRQELRSRLISSFGTELEQCIPQFQRIKPPPTCRGDLVWSWGIVPDKLTSYVLLELADNRDEFTLSIGWNERGEWPIFGLPSSRGVVFDYPECRIRLAELWSRQDPWWELVPRETDEEFKTRVGHLKSKGVLSFIRQPPVEEGLARIEPLVADAASKLREFGLPLLREVAAKWGLPWPSQ
jgi:hypothetical protein